MLPTPEQVRQYIADNLPCTHIDVQGDGAHFYATIVSTAFEGQSLVARQRLVYAALGARMDGSNAEIHALSMKNHTPDEYAAKGGAPKTQAEAGR
ncbi:YrbA protein [plant metagenome]|uniref:YrbA protein n=1 Tax=plant metagenome TaxID=1297885 RepID=A0A484S3H1_9ZZZZ